MTEDFTSEALPYLLDELDERRRAAFEAVLRENPAARLELKLHADALAAFAAAEAPAAPLTPELHRVMLATILGKTMVHHPARPPKPRRWSAYAWPAAAAVLLLLNLFQLHLRDSSEHSPLTNAGAQERAARPTATTTSPKGGDDRAETSEAPDAAIAEPPSASVEPDASASEDAPLVRLEQLRAEYAALQRERSALRAEYDGIIRELAQAALMERGLGRIAAMELVDSASYARGERKGLIDLARGLLTEPGIIAIDPSAPVVPPPAIPEPGTEGANTVPLPPPPPNQTGEPGTAPGASDPYAWSVFDEVQQQGFLNLYNLPPVSSGQTLQLWVKPAGAQDFQRVGEVPPQFYGSSGSVSYRLPETSAPPAEILITQEPRNQTGPQPTGPIILRGP